jgi:RNA-directed DNA polymerase
VNTGAPWPSLDEAETRVLEIQTKLHRWAKDAPDRQFNDLYNLVCDPAILVVAWSRVRSNRGARSAGIDKVEPRSIQSPTETFLPWLRDELKARTYTPLPVRERYIPKANGKTRRLGITMVASYCLSYKCGPGLRSQVGRVKDARAASRLDFGCKGHA